MKEFIGFSGGRTLFNEDLEALRDLSLSFSHFFDDIDLDFVISGCEAYASSGKTIINTGYVWLNGKVRKFDGANITGTPQYIYLIPQNKDGQNISYSNKKISGVMSVNYEVEASTTRPSSGSYITYNNRTAPSLTTFFSNYALLKNPPSIQTLSKDIQLLKTATAYKLKTADSAGRYAIMSVNNNGYIEIALYNAYGSLQKRYVLRNGLDIYNGTQNVLSLGSSPNNISTAQYLPTIRTNTVVTDELEAQKIVVNGKEVNINSFNNINISEWLPMMNGSIFMDGLYVKNIYNDVYISGKFPVLTSATVTRIGSLGSHPYEYKSNINLPSAISLPATKTVFPLRCKDSSRFNTSIICYFKNDRYLYFKIGPDIKFPEKEISINWHYRI